MIVRTNVIGVNDLLGKFNAMAEGFSGELRSEVALRGAEEIADNVRQKIVEQDLVLYGELLNSVEACKVNQFTAGVRVTMPYAAAHEFGLENQIITPAQRAFFWKMYAGTGDKMWKCLAVSFTYTMPARPYFRPGVEQGKRQALEAMSEMVLSILTRYGKQ